MLDTNVQRAGLSISDSLNDFVQRKLQRMEQKDLLRGLVGGQQQGSNSIDDLVSQGLQGGSVSQSLNLGDLLGGQQQNAITRSVGRTPINLPPFQAPTTSPAVQSGPPAMLPQAAPQEQPQAAPAEDRSYETPALRARRELEEKKAKDKKQLQIDKETFPYYKKIKEQAATTSEVDARLDEMDELLNTGRVQGPTLIAFFDSLKNLPWFIGKFGNVVEKAFLNEESQVFHKLSQDFLRDAKPYFGSNMSTTEVELFLERVPSLMQSEGGRRAVIRNFRSLNEYGKAVDQAMEEIITQNGGERPRHLESKVAAKVKPAGEKLRKSFRDSVKLIRKPSQDNFIRKSYEKKQKNLA